MRKLSDIVQPISLREICEIVEALQSEIEDTEVLPAPDAEGEKEFVKLHKTEKHADRAGNKANVRNGGGIKEAPYKKAPKDNGFPKEVKEENLDEVKNMPADEIFTDKGIGPLRVKKDDRSPTSPSFKALVKNAVDRRAALVKKLKLNDEVEEIDEDTKKGDSTYFKTRRSSRKAYKNSQEKMPFMSKLTNFATLGAIGAAHRAARGEDWADYENRSQSVSNQKKKLGIRRYTDFNEETENIDETMKSSIHQTNKGGWGYYHAPTSSLNNTYKSKEEAKAGLKTQIDKWTGAGRSKIKMYGHMDKRSKEYKAGECGRIKEETDLDEKWEYNKPIRSPVKGYKTDAKGNIILYKKDAKRIQHGKPSRKLSGRTYEPVKEDAEQLQLDELSVFKMQKFQKSARERIDNEFRKAGKYADKGWTKGADRAAGRAIKHQVYGTEKADEIIKKKTGTYNPSLPQKVVDKIADKMHSRNLRKEEAIDEGEAKDRPFAKLAAQVAFGNQGSKALAAGRCPSCKGEAKEFKDELSKKEYSISGMCQKCQDKVFHEENLDEVSTNKARGYLKTSGPAQKSLKRNWSNMQNRGPDGFDGSKSWGDYRDPAGGPSNDAYKRMNQNKVKGRALARKKLDPSSSAKVHTEEKNEPTSMASTYKDDRVGVRSKKKKEPTILVCPKGYKGGGKVSRIPKSEYDPKKHSLAEGKIMNAVIGFIEKREKDRMAGVKDSRERSMAYAKKHKLPMTKDAIAKRGYKYSPYED
jgi:hypothetical protein